MSTSKCICSVGTIEKTFFGIGQTWIEYCNLNSGVTKTTVVSEESSVNLNGRNKRPYWPGYDDNLLDSGYNLYIGKMT